MTTPGSNAGVKIRPHWAGTYRVQWPVRFPETHTSRVRQQELFGRMDQVEFLSVLHTVGNLLRKSLTNVSFSGEAKLETLQFEKSSELYWQLYSSQ